VTHTHDGLQSSIAVCINVCFIYNFLFFSDSANFVILCATILTLVTLCWYVFWLVVVC